MAIIRWNPLNISNLFENDFDVPTLPVLSRLGQGINLYETEDSVIAELAIPGISEDRIDITIETNIVRVTGSQEETRKEEDKRRYFISSMNTSYNYSFRLPEGITEKEPVAELDNGILTLAFEKAQKVPPKKVKVVRRKTSQLKEPGEMTIKEIRGRKTK